MLLTGVMTCSMFYAAFAPQAALQGTFGDSISGPVAEIVVRNWGALIGLTGVLLVYGAYVPVHRSLILVMASVSKLTFIGLVLTFGHQYLGKAGVVIGFDALVVAIFAVYLATAGRAKQSS
jgi:hypothetical protein